MFSFMLKESVNVLFSQEIQTFQNQKFSLTLHTLVVSSLVVAFLWE